MNGFRTAGVSVVAGVVAPGLAAVIGLAVGETRTTAAALLFLLAVLGAALWGGFAAGVAASITSFVGLNYLFTEPLRTFSVGKTDDLIALVVFVVVGVVVSTLLTMVRSNAERARRSELEALNLSAVSATLAGAPDLRSACERVVEAAREMFEAAGCSVQIGRAGEDQVVVASGDEASMLPVDVPIEVRGAILGVMRLHLDRSLTDGERRVATVLGHQIGAVAERARFETEAGAARAAAETGRIRRALLSTVSHDFRTPLAAIKAAVTSLRDDLSPDERGELLQTAHEEVERLERLVDNLLDLTRIRSGSLAPERAPIPVEDLLDRVTAGSRSILERNPLNLDLPASLPDVSVDAVQVTHAVRNVLENAGKFSPARSPIVVRAREFRGAVEIRVIDRGPGVDPSEREAVFGELYRAGDQRVAGTGLGLAIAKAIIEAHGGRISIEGTPGGGSTVVMTLPVARARAEVP